MRFSVVRYDLLFVIRLFWLFQFFSIFLRDQLEEGGGGGVERVGGSIGMCVMFYLKDFL